MKINIYTSLNGVGLERDYLLMRSILEQAGHEVAVSDWKIRQGATKADLAFHLEVPRTDIGKRGAPYNIILPNAEWYARKWLHEINRFDEIWCKTADCKRIFDKYHKKCVVTGFTSEDMYIPGISKHRIFVHVAGQSLTKGTQALVDAYKKRPDLPKCYVISETNYGNHGNLVSCGRIDFYDLKILLNSARFQICTSEYEGWGHYLHEALSCGGVVLSTDAPPMNEFITDPRCLVPEYGKQAMNMAFRSLVNSDDIIKRIESLNAMNDNELDEIGRVNRDGYLVRCEAFKSFLLNYLENFGK